MLDECKKTTKESRGFVVVRGSQLVYKIIILEGRKVNYREKVKITTRLGRKLLNEYTLGIRKVIQIQ